MAEPRGGTPILQVEGLQVHYGHAHALQGVSFSLDQGVFGIVGRNGMGKSTLCNAIMGLIPASGGGVRLAGRSILGLTPDSIVARGIGYVPQGRRVWPSLTVDETLRLAARSGRRSERAATWDVARVYETFPRLAERRRNGGGQLSGGEQQMLAIGRALLANPLLLVMDEPTEGLAPVIVQHLAELLKRLAREGDISVLLIEQNLGVATEVAERIGIMVNGQLLREMPAAELAADLDLQQRLLGVGSHGGEETDAAATEAAPAEAPEEAPLVLRIRRSSDGPRDDEGTPAYRAEGVPTRWSQGNPLARTAAPPAEAAPASRAERDAALRATLEAERGGSDESLPAAMRIPAGRLVDRAAYVAGTFDTKARELLFLKHRLERLGLRVVTVDLSTSGRPSSADVGPAEIARHHPAGAHAVFSGERGPAVAAMAEAFARFLPTRRDVGGVISAGGSGGTALATSAMQRLPIGLPKVMVSTVASGDVRRYVGPSDICMIYSVTDVQGINRISERVLSNAAHALAGMVAHAPQGRESESKPAIGLTMFGVTTPCVQAVAAALEADYDCLVFHATGTGGQSMEKLADSGLLAGILDVSTTEVADLLVGGVFPASEDRFGAVIRSRLPYVGSVGALDMVNFGPRETVPERFRNRKLHQHNPQVTLMRTTAEENAAMGRWIAERLNRCEGPLRFLLPEGGVSLLDAPGKDFWDPEADRALFAAIEQGFRPGPRRRLVRLPWNINDPAFAAALVENFRAVAKEGGAAMPSDENRKRL